MQGTTRRLVVAIDGPAGSGKSTVARAVAARLGIAHLDTGAMYRAVTAAGLAAGLDPGDGPAMTGVARSLSIALDGSALVVDGRPAGPELRTPAVDGAVSQVSAHPGVRTALVEHQRTIMQTTDVVAEGRDIATVVYPDAPVKIFLTASIAERARRRRADLSAAGHDIDEPALAAQITERDRLDSERTHSPLATAADATVIDTTGMTIEEVVTQIAGMAEAVR